MKEKFATFFKKFNNSYLLAAICFILVAVIAFGLMIGILAKPFITNIAYSTTIITDSKGDVKAKIVLMDSGVYSVTAKDGLSKQFTTTYNVYAYGKLVTDLDESDLIRNVIWFDDDVTTMVIQKSPFRLEYEGATYTNAGGIVLLVFYIVLWVFAAIIAAVFIVKRKQGRVVFTNKMRLVKRLKELEEMLGVRHE